VMRTSSSLRRTCAAMAGAAGLVLVSALPAAAHVHVSSSDAAPGGFGKLVFSVPNESDSAEVTQLVVKLPTDTPLASVSTKPMSGWSVEAEPTELPEPVQVNGATVTEAVTQITWTAQKGQGLAPDQFAEFEVSAGPFPEHVDQLTFPTIQTYSDGEVVRWVQPVEAGSPEPERPAPVLELTDAGDTVSTVDVTSSVQQPTAETDEVSARVLSGVAIAIAAVALLAALRPRRPRS
jgi:periplasmic copper chaperone A